MIIIGRLAEKYNMLPHQVIENATTYDYIVTDVLRTYDEYQYKLSQGQDVSSLLKSDNLKEIWEKHRAN